MIWWFQMSGEQRGRGAFGAPKARLAHTRNKADRFLGPMAEVKRIGRRHEVVRFFCYTPSGRVLSMCERLLFKRDSQAACPPLLSH